MYRLFGVIYIDLKKGKNKQKKKKKKKKMQSVTSQKSLIKASIHIL